VVDKASASVSFDYGGMIAGVSQSLVIIADCPLEDRRSSNDDTIDYDQSAQISPLVTRIRNRRHAPEVS